jgi:hypothetical protein
MAWIRLEAHQNVTSANLRELVSNACPLLWAKVVAVRPASAQVMRNRFMIGTPEMLAGAEVVLSALGAFGGVITWVCGRGAPLPARMALIPELSCYERVKG